MVEVVEVVEVFFQKNQTTCGRVPTPSIWYGSLFIMITLLVWDIARRDWGCVCNIVCLNCGCFATTIQQTILHTQPQPAQWKSLRGDCGCFATPTPLILWKLVQYDNVVYNIIKKNQTTCERVPNPSIWYGS